MSTEGPGSSRALRATYRLQLRGGVGFREAEALMPYLAALGVSHVYGSPCMEASAGSTHGYDVVDPRRLDPALGSEQDFDAFVSALHACGMGLILDWVPNHVGVAAGQNPWWDRLLAFGRGSPTADFFDVDWTPGRPELRGKVLLPVLGDPYGDVLERGEIVPERDPDGGLCLRYFEHRFPVSPDSWGRLLASALGGSAASGHDTGLWKDLDALRRRTGPRDERVRRALEAQRRLAARIDADAELSGRVDGLVAGLRGEVGRPQSFDRLHALLESQHYRLAHWRVAGDEINYRRFFDINELAALRMESPEVFRHVHERVLEWIASGRIDGLRIDHVDGLADPEGYCRKLREATGRAWIVVEKILGSDERLPESWPVDGTTGYEFLNLVNGLFVDPAGRRPVDRLYRSFTGDDRDFDEVLRASKRRVMESLLSSDLDGLVNALDHVAQSDRHTRDFTRRMIREALVGILAAFPVYRTYVGRRGATDGERSCIGKAVDDARAHDAELDSTVTDWVASILTGDRACGERSVARRRRLERLATRFEQYSAPVMAKGLEDTSFYRYLRLISLNEVGGDPRRFGTDLERFHAANRERAVRWPRAMTSTATHDTKRGEDARARIDVLSECPAAWRSRVRAWARSNRRLRREVAGRPAPCRSDEYFLYQVLVGSFPSSPVDVDALAAYRDRVQAYLVKALREGKERSSWRHPRHAYERAVTDFVARLLEPDSDFLASFLPFQRRVAEQGALNGLAQVVLKLTCPGIPDLYQGCEDWDLSLADPDNRRPVDFEARRATLAAFERQTAGGDVDPSSLRALRDAWPDGRIKHWVTWRLLGLRRRRPDLFAQAGYLALEASGERAHALCAFARLHAGDALVVVVPRLCLGLPRAPSGFPLGNEAWGRTVVELTAGLDADGWRDAVTDLRVEPRSAGRAGTLEVARLFEELPLAVLVRDRSAP